MVKGERHRLPQVVYSNISVQIKTCYTAPDMMGHLERMQTERTVITPLVDRHTQLFGGTWTDRVGGFIDSGVADHINSHHMLHGFDADYPILVSDALLSGVASVMRHEQPQPGSETMHRVGDALLGAIEAYDMHHSEQRIRISSGIADFIAWDHPIGTSVSLFCEVIDAVDRKVQRDRSGQYLYVGNSVVKKEQGKIALSQSIMAQIDAGTVSRRNHFPGERGIAKWTQLLPDSHRSYWFYALEKSIAPWGNDRNDIVSTRLIHPHFAVDAIREGIAYLSGTQHDIPSSSRMLISMYERMVSDVLHTNKTTEELEHAIAVRLKTHTMSSSEIELVRQRMIDYTQSLSAAESTDSRHVIALILLAKTLPLYTQRTRSAFDAIIRRGVFHHDPAVRRVCFNAMATALEIEHLQPEYKDTLRKRIFYKLFPKEPTPQTGGYWQELMQTASLSSIETWLTTASTSHRRESIGVIAWRSFQSAYEQKHRHLSNSPELNRIQEFALSHTNQLSASGIDVSWLFKS